MLEDETYQKKVLLLLVEMNNVGFFMLVFLVFELLFIKFYLMCHTCIRLLTVSAILK